MHAAGGYPLDKSPRMPPFGETQKYVRVITGRYGKSHHPVYTPEVARVEFRLGKGEADKGVPDGVWWFLAIGGLLSLGGLLERPPAGLRCPVHTLTRK